MPPTPSDMSRTTNRDEDSQDELKYQTSRASVHSAVGLALTLTPGNDIVRDGKDSHPAQDLQEEEEEEPDKYQYSVFSKRKKQSIVLAGAGGAVFSTLTAQTYLPALQVLADDFHVSISQINLTLTVYLVFQGVTPMFIGSFADRLGRRLAYIICFVVYIAASIALAEAQDYAQLLGLRCLQAAGISGTQTLCQAVVADVVTSAERGQYIGFVTLSAILGPSLGPIIGGLLTDSLGWRSIFWFLAICGIVVLILILFFFPETCRPIVGDGSIVPPKTHQTFVQLIKNRRSRRNGGSQSPVPPSAAPEGKAPGSKFAGKHLLTSIKLLWNRELGLLLAYGGLIYSGINAISAALPTQFTKIYGFNSLEIGCMFLPMAGGSVIAVGVAGKALNWNYRRHATRLGLTVDKTRQIDLIDFPIERARLEVAIPLLYVSAIVMISWGWALESQTSVAVPCVLSFCMGVVYIGVINVFNALITDLYRKEAGAAVAANWFVRCMFGAVMTAVIQPLIESIGVGWAYTIFGASYIVFSPCLFLIMWKGMGWRKEEREKQERKAAANEEQRIGGNEEESTGENAEEKTAEKEEESIGENEDEKIAEKEERRDSARDSEEGVVGTG